MRAIGYFAILTCHNGTRLLKYETARDGKMANPLHKGGPTVAIFRPKKKDADPDVPVADFSYQNDALAQMIVYAWADKPFRDSLLAVKPDGTSPGAKSALEQRGVYLANPIIITEDHYNTGYHKTNDNEVVFVLPNFQRHAGAPHGHSLLETARLLMACTPNGI
jgi:hypothetical protein